MAKNCKVNRDPSGKIINVKVTDIETRQAEVESLRPIVRYKGSENKRGTKVYKIDSASGQNLGTLKIRINNKGQYETQEVSIRSPFREMGLDLRILVEAIRSSKTAIYSSNNLTPSARQVWQSLESRGFAELLPDGRYVSVKENIPDDFMANYWEYLDTTTQTPLDPVKKSEEALQWAKDNADWVVANTVQEGGILDPDNIRNVFRSIGYNGKNVPIYRAAEKYIIDRIYEAKLNKAEQEGNKTIVFLTGVGGAGKSSATSNLDFSGKSIIFDSAFNSFSSLEKQLKKAHDRGFDIEVVAVHNDPVTAFTNTVGRGITSGRFLSLSYFIEAYNSNRGKIQRLTEKYPNVVVRAYDNSRNNTREVTVEDAKNWVYEVNNNIIEELLNVINNENRFDKDQLASVADGLQQIVGSEGIRTATMERLIGRISTRLERLRQDSRRGVLGNTQGGGVRVDFSISEDTRTLEDLREEIDTHNNNIINNIDNPEVLEDIIVDRNKTVLAIAKLKRRMGLPVLDSSRENIILQRMIERGKDIGIPTSQVETIFNRIFTLSKQLQEDFMGKTANYSNSTQEFFSEVSKEESRHSPNKKWKPHVILNKKEQETLKVLDSHSGTFDAHISTSIPGFKETQVKKATAIVDMYGTAPRVVNQELEQIKIEYQEQKGLPQEPVVFPKVDNILMAEIAELHDNTPDNREDPEMVESYEAFLEETKSQFELLQRRGYSLRPYLGKGEPYGVYSSRVRKALKENKELFYLQSVTATGDNNSNDTADNYMPFRESGVIIDGQPVLLNDMFRAVHDVFGHGMTTASFSTQGELNAYQVHKKMYSEKAQKALFMETVVYNAYYNSRGRYAPRKIYNIPQSLIDKFDSGPLMYDIGGSEGTTVKTITQQSNGNIHTINIEPNAEMNTASEKTNVPNSTYVSKAFYEGFENIEKFTPLKKADIVNETMTFQFISPYRAEYIREIKNNYLKEDGLFLTEEKLTPISEEAWEKNENYKDNVYKSEYYSDQQLDTKRSEVLSKMFNTQTPTSTYLALLQDNFTHVVEYWDGGNFKGYAASNSKNTIDSFVNSYSGKVVFRDGNFGVESIRQGQQQSMEGNNIQFQTNSRGQGTTPIPNRILDSIIEKLRQSNLATKVNVLSSQGILNKLLELGVGEDIALQVIAWHGRTRELNYNDRSSERTYGEVMSGVYFGERYVATAFAGVSSFSGNDSGRVAKASIDDSDFYTIDMQGTTPGNDQSLQNIIGAEQYSEILALKAEGKIKGLRLTNTREFLEGEQGPATQYVVYDTSLINTLKEYRGEQIKALLPVLFSKGVNLTVQGFVINGEVYINRDGVDPVNTAIHEFGHLWNSWAKRNAPQVYQRGIELVKGEQGKPYVDFVREQQPNLTGEALYEEALAQAIGDNGSKFVNEQQAGSFTEWLQSLWDAVKEVLGISQEQDISNMTLDEFARAASIELLSGNPIVQRIEREFLIPEINRIKNESQSSETGSTMNLDGTQYNGGGLVVPVISINTTQSELSPEMIENFLNDNSGKIGSGIVKVGLYKFPNSDQVSIDLNIVVPSEHRDVAIEFGRMAGQESLFNLDNFENDKTGADGTNPIVFTDEQFKVIAESLEQGILPESVFNEDSSTRQQQDSFLQESDFNPDGSVKQEVLQEIEQERAEIEQTARNNGTWMKAPNGNPTNLNEEQWVTVRTRRFKTWFGDWQNDPQNASKVVDENGEPLVVYHGTEAEFTEFKPTKPNFYRETEGWYFFTDKKESAKTFGKNVMPVFLNIDNPTIETTGHFNTWNLYDDEGNYGFIAPNTDTGNGGVANQYVVENPNQIKSATDNVGTYSDQTGNIRLSIVGERGATQLDKLNEVTTLLDSLSDARKMEEEGKTPSQIRFTTGWEKGNDGKWRYELDDSNASLNFNIKSKNQLGKKYNLSTILKHDELFKTYPELKKVKISISEKGGTTKDAYFDGEQIVLGISTYDLDKVLRRAEKKESLKNVPKQILEIANRDVERDRYEDLLRNQGKTLGESRNLGEEKYPRIEEHDKILLDLGYAKIETHFGIDIILPNDTYYEIFSALKEVRRYEEVNGIPGESLLNINKDLLSVVMHEIQHWIQKKEGFSRGGNLTLAYDNLTREELSRYKELEKAAEEELKALEEVGQKWYDQPKEVRDIVLAPNTFLHSVYQRIAGETEARNVETRLGFTAEQRRETLLQETEDVAREDQINLFYRLSESESGEESSRSLRLTGLSENATRESISKATVRNIFEPIIEVLKQNNFINNIVLGDSVQASSMFSRDGSVIKGAADSKNNIFINIDTFTADTPIHEAGHLWATHTKKNNKVLYDQGISLIKKEGQEYIEYVKRTQPELKGEDILEEALAQAIGDNGAKLINNNQNSDFKQWLKDLFDWVANAIGISDYVENGTVDQLTLEQFSTAVAVELLKDKPSGKILHKQSYGNSSIGIEVEYVEEGKRNQLIREGKLKVIPDISELHGQHVVVHGVDNMFTGNMTITNKKDGTKEVIEGNGGVYFVTKFGEVWASSNSITQKRLIGIVNQQLEANKEQGLGDKTYILLSSGESSKLKSNTQGALSVLKIAESLFLGGLVSRRDFESSVRKAFTKKRREVIGDIQITSKMTPKELIAEIDRTFSDPSSSTFKLRGDVVGDIVTNIAKTASYKKNSAKVNSFLGVKEEGPLKVQDFLNTVARVVEEGILREQEAYRGYALIEVSQPLVPKETAHGAYPFAVGYADGTSPKLIIVENPDHLANSVDAMHSATGSYITPSDVESSPTKYANSNAIGGSGGLNRGRINVLRDRPVETGVEYSLEQYHRDNLINEAKQDIREGSLKFQMLDNITEIPTEVLREDPRTVSPPIQSMISQTFTALQGIPGLNSEQALKIYQHTYSNEITEVKELNCR